jgi:hypothetical protein
MRLLIKTNYIPSKQTRQIDKFNILFVMRGIDWKLDEDSPHKCVVEPYYLELEYAVFIRGRNMGNTHSTKK